MKNFLKLVLTVIAFSSLGKSEVDWKIVGDALITKANHIQDPTPAQFLTNTILNAVKVKEKGTYEKLEDQTSSDNINQSIEETTAGGSLATWGEGSNEDSMTTNPPKPINSTEAAPTPRDTFSYPWLASIQKDKKQICTGTLIDSRHVLLTAYCLENVSSKDLADVEVDIGYHAVSISKFRQYELTQGPYMTVKVKKSIRHLRFSPATAYNDIALLQLITPIVASEAVGPIKLLNDTGVGDDKLHHIIGWRDGQDLNGESTLYWRDEKSKGSTLDECRNSYSDILDGQGISPGMLCSGGYSDATSCRWKFGTPLILDPRDEDTRQKTLEGHQLIQIGIYSWGSEAILPKCRFSPQKPKPMVFTRIASYYDWIQRNILH